MQKIKPIIGVMFLTLLVIAACGKKAGEKPAVLFENDTQVVDQFKKMKAEGKNNEALALINRGLQQFPASMKLIREKFGILRAEKRYEECLQMLNQLLPKVSKEVKTDILNGKQAMLQKLVQSELEKGNTRKAFLYLEELADAGYRGFHQFKHNELYEPLHRMPRFNDIMKKIAHNTGIGQPAKDFTVKLTSGETFTLSKQKGKVVLLDFWGTRCKPCIKELPNLRTYYQSFKDKGFDIVSISLDDDKVKLGAFLETQPMPWKTVFSGYGWNDDTARLYEISWIPSLWLVDKKGILRYFDIRGEDLKAAVNQLVNE
jgi:peroxiredoxin